ncbi:MAG: hypothetical protein A2901_06845 [Elusimicrobia bacterium RIFCSPLOWO2_01_FULL_54_10]|nr:MAG: hypothetical protein A2901_06845 [Elusimicrobia bacterium RIFCSPLOWO2_01_FULL_54_10]
MKYPYPVPRGFADKVMSKIETDAPIAWWVPRWEIFSTGLAFAAVAGYLVLGPSLNENELSSGSAASFDLASVVLEGENALLEGISDE